MFWEDGDKEDPQARRPALGLEANAWGLMQAFIQLTLKWESLLKKRLFF